MRLELPPSSKMDGSGKENLVTRAWEVHMCKDGERHHHFRGPPIP